MPFFGIMIKVTTKAVLYVSEVLNDGISVCYIIKCHLCYECVNSMHRFLNLKQISGKMYHPDLSGFRVNYEGQRCGSIKPLRGQS